MSSFLFHGIMAAVTWTSFVIAEETINLATSDTIQIKSVEWKNNTVGTLFLIEYKCMEKPQIVWGRSDYLTRDDEMFPILVPYAENQKNWINTFSNTNGLLILHIPHAFKSRYLYVSFSLDDFTLEIKIDRIFCEKQGQKGKTISDQNVITVNGFGDTNKEMKNVTIRIESHSDFRDVSAVYCTVNDRHNISSTAIDLDDPDSYEKDGFYENVVKVEKIPFNSILSIRYRALSHGWISGIIYSYQYQHTMIIRNPASKETIVSLLTDTVNTKPEIPLTTTGLVKCVAFGFPRPSIYFLRGPNRLEPNHKYDVTLDYVTISYLEIPKFSLADRGNYRCVAQSGSSRSYIDFKVSHSPRVSRDKTIVKTLTRDKVEILCIADGDEGLKVTFRIEYGRRYNSPSFVISESKTISVDNVTSDVIITQTSTSSTRKSTHLVILNPNVQDLSSIECDAEDSIGYDSHTVFQMKELNYIKAYWFDSTSYMKTAVCKATIYGPPEEHMPDIITIEWYKSEVKPENKINPDVNTIIATQNDNKYDDPESFLLLLDSRSRDPLGYDIICRAYTRFKEYTAVVKSY